MLHEAKTNESSKIKTAHQRDQIIEIMEDRRNLIVYRDNFYDGIKMYIEAYKMELLESKELKVNFIRKFDDLVDIKDDLLWDGTLISSRPKI